MRNIILIAIFVAVTGCANSPETPKAIYKWERLTYSNTAVAAADSTAVFALVFQDKNAGWFNKRNLENEGEYRHRLAKAGEGVTGQEFTFLIVQDDVEVKADPDALRYSVKIKESLGSKVTVQNTSQYGAIHNMQNALGAQIQVQTIEVFEQNLDIGDFEKLPPQLMIPYKSIGITVQFSQSQKDQDSMFRNLIENKMLGFAIRGKIGDISKSSKRHYESTPTFDSPRIFITEIEDLPFDIEEVSLVARSQKSNEFNRLLGYAKPR